MVHIALNQIWRVEHAARPKVVRFVRRRFLSLVIVFMLALAILATVVIRVALRAASEALSNLGALPTDTDWGGSGIPVYVDQKSLLYLDGITVDYHEDIMQRGFVFKNPKATATCGCGTSFSV